MLLGLPKPVLCWFQRSCQVSKASCAEVEVCWMVAQAEGGVDGRCLGQVLLHSTWLNLCGLYDAEVGADLQVTSKLMFAGAMASPWCL